MIIENFRFKDFIEQDAQLINDYMSVLSHLKGIPNFSSGKLIKKKYGVVKSLTELKFGEVNKLKRLMLSNNIESVFESISTAYNYPLKKIPNLQISIFYACLNFIVKEIKHIIKVENHRYKIITSKYDDLMNEAGIERLDRFGEMVIIDQITDGKLWNFKRVEELPYMLVHSKIWLEAEKTNINIRKEELINNMQ